MLFNSWVFVLFALPVFAGYFCLPHRKQNAFLLVASYVFYGYWDWRFLSLLAISTVVDFEVGRRLGRTEEPRARKLLLGASLAVNLGILGFFKYFDFFLASAGTLLANLGLGGLHLDLSIVLPVGISFYTFQTLSYSIDVYRRDLEPVEDWLDFALFVAFFPQLVAGPIERAGNLLPQLRSPRKLQRSHLTTGAWLLLWGLFKKVVIADNLAPYVDDVYGSASAATSLEILLATYAFAYQIYCDFSGYSDMARGLSRLLGIELSRNFDIPYLAATPSEFWRRWHISLSGWLRDYLYISLGGNREGARATRRNLLITMVLGGLWHGAAWNFVLWGAFHGALLIGYRSRTAPTAGGPGPVRKVLARVGFFHLVCLGWLLFRARSLQDVVVLLGNLLTRHFLTVSAVAMAAVVTFFVALLWCVEGWIRNADDPTTRPGWSWGGPLLVGILMVLILFLTPPASRSFIYFQF